MRRSTRPPAPAMRHRNHGRPHGGAEAGPPGRLDGVGEQRVGRAVGVVEAAVDQGVSHELIAISLSMAACWASVGMKAVANSRARLPSL